MTTFVKYLGGKKHGQNRRMDLRDLPERGEGGQYIHFASFAFAACDPEGPYPEPTSSAAVWVADS